MSLLRHRDKSFRNIMATWGGLQRSQAALICSVGKTSPLCPSPALLPPWTEHVPGCHREPTQIQQELGMKRIVKSGFKKKKHDLCSWLILDVPAVGMGLLRDQCDPAAPGQTALPQRASRRDSRSMDCLSLHWQLWRICQTKPSNSKIRIGWFSANRPNIAL